MNLNFERVMLQINEEENEIYNDLKNMYFKYTPQTDRVKNKYKNI